MTPNRFEWYIYIYIDINIYQHLNITLVYIYWNNDILISKYLYWNFGIELSVIHHCNLKSWYWNIVIEIWMLILHWFYVYEIIVFSLVLYVFRAFRQAVWGSWLGLSGLSGLAGGVVAVWVGWLAGWWRSVAASGTSLAILRYNHSTLFLIPPDLH